MTLSRALAFGLLTILAAGACAPARLPDPGATMPSSPTSPSPGVPGSSPARPGSTIGTGTARPPAAASTTAQGLVVPRAGTYIYDVTERGHNATGPTNERYEQTAEVDRPVKRDDGSVSVEIRTRRERSDEVAGEVFLYRTNRIDLLFADGCVLDRPAAWLRLPLREGASWASPRSCEGRSDTATTRVVDRATHRVGDVTVETFVVRRTARIGDRESIKTQWWSPDHRLVVRSELHETIDGRRYSLEQVLRSLRPT